MDNKTIYALSTVFGKSGVAIFRVSGNAAFEVFAKMTTLPAEKIVARQMYFTPLLDSVSRETLDHCMAVGFRAPHSFTGEDTVEIHCHGSKAVIKSVIKALSELPNYRLAEAGEFSRRAFYNGKMDLTEADGLADLIDAETAIQQKTALQQMGGTLLQRYDSWRNALVEILSYVEAYIDFPDEDIPQDVVENIENGVFKTAETIREHLQGNHINERLRDGFRVVIAGPANAGKSSLINAIVKRNVAIVSDIAGTTRDVIDAYVDIKGYPVVFSDTAGLRDAADEIEKIGISLAKEKIAESDFKIFIFDAATDGPEIFADYIKSGEDYVLVANKIDKLSADVKQQLISKNCLLISAKHNENVDALVDRIYNHFNDLYLKANGGLITRQRYREALLECLENLDRFNLQKDIALAAEDIRLACRAIGKITGRVEVDEILDKIFGSFCIGK
ncbi:MAG: tRNA uridine-5-carboxymethylaminomethyl(34) synthesis GTPase MnmE [Alphaproteobacteria bacterium]|nr:tRNA uridine-5-carboxymethylaminomethyl(34) synthesis GTPase MnmE [Alphaproteobacteria bacterium]